MKTNLNPLMISTTLLCFLAACGQSKTDDGSGNGSGSGTVTSVTGGSTAAKVSSQPSNSTNVLTKLGLSIATFGKPKLALLAPTTFDVGGGIVLSSARVSIGAIKIKANKDKSEEENKLEEVEASEGKEDDAQKDEKKKLVELKIDRIEADYKVLIDAAVVESDKDLLKAEMTAKIAVEKVALAAADKAGEEVALEKAAERDDSLKWKGPYVYDAITGTVDQPIPSVELVDGNYQRFEFTIMPNRSLAGADPMLNNALYIAGSAVIGAKTVPFSIAYDAEENFRLTGKNGVKADIGASNSMLIAFDVKGWFTGMDLAMAVPDSQGSILIDRANNPELLKAFKKNLKRFAKFGEDEDGDGQLGASEDEGDGTEAVEAEEAGEAQGPK